MTTFKLGTERKSASSWAEKELLLKTDVELATTGS